MSSGMMMMKHNPVQEPVLLSFCNSRSPRARDLTSIAAIFLDPHANVSLTSAITKVRTHRRFM
jgi:hypothetical protein